MLESYLAGRRNIAQYLHDTVCQDMIALALAVTRCQRESGSAAGAGLARALELIERCNSDLRALTLILAPPVFDHVEGKSTLGWYIEVLRTNALLNVRFEDATSRAEDDVALDQRTRKMLLAAVQTWAELAVGRLNTATRIRLSAGPRGFEFEFLSSVPSDSAVEAVRQSPLLLATLRDCGGRMEVVPDHAGSSARLIFAGQRQAI